MGYLYKKNSLKKFSLFITALLFFTANMLVAYGASDTATNENIVLNGDFEEVQDNGANYWGLSTWVTDGSKFIIDSENPKSGMYCVKIESSVDNDARFVQTLNVEPSTYYKISCFARTKGVGSEAKGANISVLDITNTSEELRGDNDWQYIEMYGVTGKEQTTFTVSMGLGGYGSINKGTAWFDDCKVVKLDKKPEGKEVYNLFAETNNQNTSVKDDGQPSYSKVITPYFFIFFVIIILIFLYIKNKDINISGTNEKIILILMLSAGFILRLILSCNIEGFSVDVNTNKAWALNAAKNFTNIYSTDSFIDYPPVMMYIYALIAHIKNIFNVSSQGYTLLIKLPAVIADIALAFLLYKAARKRFGSPLALLASALILFNPVVFIDSAIWGQVDSVLTLSVLVSLIFLYNGKIGPATAFFAISVLLKPQGVFFLPILLYELIKRKNLKDLGKAVLWGGAATLAIILPFSFTEKSIFWIFDLYLQTAGQYDYASFNAFNFFAFLGSNNIKADDIFIIFSYKVWGFIFDALIVIGGFIFYMKSKVKYLPFVMAVMLNAAFFCFSIKMHERYMFPVIILIFFAAILANERKFMYAAGLFSISVFFNINDVLRRYIMYDYPHVPSNDMFMRVISFITLAALGYMIYASVSVCIKGRSQPIVVLGEAGKDKKKQVQNEKANQSVNTSKKGVIYDVDLNNPDMSNRIKLAKNDYIIMGVMTGLYLILALFNLGGFKSPNTEYQPMQMAQSFVVDLGERASLDRLYYYSGLRDRKYDSACYRVEYMDENGNFLPLTKIENNKEKKVEMTFYKWNYLKIDVDANTGNEVVTDKLRFIVDRIGGTLNEIAVTKKGSKEPMKLAITDMNLAGTNNVGDPTLLIDEQDAFDYAGSLRTSTYFDEIYHARTALEHIRLTTVYETTHPPLGKLFISLGILIFGMNPFGWRIIGTLFGVAMIPLMYLFGLKIFSKRFLAFASAFLMMFDFMHFAQTRIATIDVYGVFFIIGMYYFMYDYFVYKSYNLGYKKSLYYLGMCGLFFGLGAASKWIVLYGGAGLAILFFITKYNEYRDYSKITSKRKIDQKYMDFANNFTSKYLFKTILFCCLFFLIIPVIIYFLSYIPTILVPGSANNFSDAVNVVLNAQKSMYNYHSTLNATHSYSSEWWSWPIIQRPMLFYRNSEVAEGLVASIATLGNPAIWWTGIPCTLFAIYISIKKRDRRMVVVFMAFAFQYVPWMLVSRLVFIYHFFASVPFIIFIICYCMEYFMNKYKNAKYVIYGYLGLVLLLFIMYYPVLSGTPVKPEYITFLRWFKSWSF